ncbi:MAG TPA: aspartate carbamoyltransferase catalytic subunit, partial [Xylella sp.]
MQLDSNGCLRHLITLEGLSRAVVLQVLDCAAKNCTVTADHMSKRHVLAGMAVCTLFFEPSTRTCNSFHLAAQRLGADVLNFDASMSSMSKGESARDTLKNLEAMGVRGFIVRHPEDAVIAQLTEVVREGTVLINAGAGRSSHPTQALLDMLTLCQAKGNDFSKLKLLMVGDIKHSRVARSNLHALRTLGAGEIRVCGPEALLP